MFLWLVPLLLCVQVKAKVVRSYVDKMITLAKDGSLHARRQVRHHGSAATAVPAAVSSSLRRHAAAGPWGCTLRWRQQ
jgi:ribosomal protein L17